MTTVLPVPALTIGGFTFVDIENQADIVILKAAAGSGNYDTFSTPAGVDYQASGGILTVLAVRFYINGNSGQANFLYGDNGVTNTTAPTNPIFWDSHGSSQTSNPCVNTAASTSLVCDWVGTFSVPDTKYPALFATGSGCSATMIARQA